jgi:hypothetical protein
MSNHTALIQDLFANITREGWSTKFNDALADDLVWVATGSSPVAGTYEGKQLGLSPVDNLALGDVIRHPPVFELTGVPVLITPSLPLFENALLTDSVD